MCWEQLSSIRCITDAQEIQPGQCLFRLQSDLADAKEGLRREWTRAHAAASERSAAMDRLEQVKSVAVGILAKQRDSSAVYQSEYTRLYDHKGQDLEIPEEYWMASACRNTLGD